jgi:signal transduction histidine kinase/CheY-like chemotaxis protein
LAGQSEASDVLAQLSIDTVEPGKSPGLCRQVLPLIVGIVLVNVTVMLALLMLMADRAERSEQAHQTRLIDLAFEDTLSQFALLAFGFANWDPMSETVGTDPPWLKAHFNAMPARWIGGDPTPVDQLALLAAVPAGANVRGGFLRIADQLYLGVTASAGPERSDLPKPHILVSPVDRDLLDRIGRRLGLVGLTAEPVAPDLPFTFDNGHYDRLIVSGSGEPLGRFRWQSAATGQAMIRIAVVPLLVLSLCVGAVVWWTFQRVSRIEAWQNSVERARREAELACLVARQAEQDKTELIATASHDLRQPLNAIGLLLNVLRSYVSDVRALDIVGHMQGSLDAMTDLFNRLLDLSQVEAGAIEAKVEAVSLASILRRVETDFVPVAASKGLGFRIVRTRAAVSTDPILLERILRNLVSNAIHHTATGRILVGCRRRGRNIGIEVFDTGPGIPETEREHIFTPFYQVREPGRTQNGKGHGLGLAIVQRLALLLGHDIECRSEVGHGTCFSVELPQSQRVPAVEIPQVRVPPLLAALQCLRNFPALVIMEDRWDAEDLCIALEDLGCSVRIARTAEEAATRPDLIIDPPGLIIANQELSGEEDGVTAIVQVRQAARIAIPACVLVTAADATMIKRIRAIDAGWLEKPVRQESLRGLVEAVVQAGLPPSCPVATQNRPARACVPACG